MTVCSMAPHKQWGGFLLTLVKNVGKRRRPPGHGAVVRAHTRRGQNPYDGAGHDEPCDSLPNRDPRVKERTYYQCACWNSGEQPLERAAIRKNCQPNSERDCRGDRRHPANSRNRSVDQSASSGGHCAAPVAICPRGNGEPRDNRDRPDQGPWSRQPCLHHPAQRRGHEREAQPYADNGIAAECPADRKYQGLRGWILRRVRRSLQDVKGVEILGKRVRGIGEPK